MDFSNNKDNSQQKEAFRPTIYSNLSFQNPEGKVEKSRLGISYWKGLLTLSFAQKKENSNSDFTNWDMDNQHKIYLTPFKAMIFADGIEKVLAEAKDKDGKVIKNAGVPVKNGVIYVGKASEIGIDSDDYVLVACDVDNNGIVTASSAYEFTSGYHYGVYNYESKEAKFSTISYDSKFELNRFKEMLRNYASASDGAIAAQVCDAYQTTHANYLNKKLDAISDKLGIERPKYGNSNSSFFNSGSNNGGAKMNTGSAEPIDGLESMLDELDI